jgi:DNA (cytosine-5)-methyltransferase 1
MGSFVNDFRNLDRKALPEPTVVRDGLRHQAGQLLREFETIFGDRHPALTELSPKAPGFQVAAAWHAFRKVKDGSFGIGHDFALQVCDIGPSVIDALQALTGKSVPAGGLRHRSGLTALPSARYRLKALELCAGAGGMALGLEQAGFQQVALIEYDRNAAATLRKNRPGWPVVEADVRKDDFTRYRKDGIDLLAGGLPCTPYTTVSERKGKLDENDLLPEGVRAVQEVQPKAFIFENVEGILHSSHADHLADALKRLTKAGYRTQIHRINARDHGIAQDRSRILIVGVREEFAAFNVDSPDAAVMGG